MGLQVRIPEASAGSRSTSDGEHSSPSFSFQLRGIVRVPVNGTNADGALHAIYGHLRFCRGLGICRELSRVPYGTNRGRVDHSFVGGCVISSPSTV